MEEKELKRNSKGVDFGFGINNCPLHLYKAFVKDIKTRHNDTYWSRLQELLIKEECYDNFIRYGLIPVEQQEDEDDLIDQLSKKEEDKEEQGSSVMTMGGKIRVN